MPLQNVIALLFDCDDTLCSDTTEFLLGEYGVKIEEFWSDVGRMVGWGWDPPLAYMTLLIERVQYGEIPDLTTEKLRDIGRKIRFFPGVPRVFEDLRKFVKSESAFREAGVSLEYYVVSGGLEELIRGSVIAPHMTDIFGCTFSTERRTGLVSWPQSIVTFTEKTKFVFAINKGIPGSILRRSPYRVNDAISKDERRIPFQNMIYVGDGPSDIPCFSLIRSPGGHGVGVYKKGGAKKGYQLARGNRTTVGPYRCDYRNGHDLRNALEQIVAQIGLEIVEKNRIRTVSAPTHS